MGRWIARMDRMRMSVLQQSALRMSSHVVMVTASRQRINVIWIMTAEMEVMKLTVVSYWFVGSQCKMGITG